MSFWAILGFLALINSLREQKRRPKPELLGQGLRIVGTFAVIAILWSLWTSPTFTDWFALLTLTEPWQIESSDLLRLAAILTPLLIGLLIVLLGRRFERHQTIESWLEKLKNTSFRPYLNATAVAATILFLIAIFDPAVYRRFGSDAARTMISLTSPALSRRDDLLLTRGYYEELANVNRFNTELWQLYQEQPPDWKSLAGVRAINLRDDLLEYDLLPNLEIYYKRAAFSTNNWGMRDKEYTQLVPENTCRMALLGSSIVMGAGVTDREVFEWRLEEQLNDDSRLTKHVEILNFASGGYFPLHRMAVLEEKAMAFNPDVVIYVSHPRNELTSDYIVELYRKNITFPEEIEQILEATEIQESMADIVIQKRIQTVIDDITLTIYRRIADQSKANGILPIMVLVPRVDGEEADDVRQVIQLGQEAGFIVIDLTDVYAEYEPSAIWVAAWDHHPNSTGHALIAERLYQEIQTNPELASMCSQ